MIEVLTRLVSEHVRSYGLRDLALGKHFVFTDAPRPWILGEVQLTSLARRKCVPCDGKTPPMTKEDAQKYLQELPGWTLNDNQIDKEFKFKAYLDGVEFAYSLGMTAEKEDHHPDILIKWRRVKVTLTTHAIKGLSENDFIIAAKAEEIYRKLQFRRIALLLYEKRRSKMINDLSLVSSVWEQSFA